ncbi:kinase [Nocardia tengchongensis]|uniref:phosphotransferase-like protein n=1 Tax=Nocardia tengchongensis TaxID=2055889 RepID=UPI0033C45908
MSSAVILYGPPASGKDTVTDALTAADSAYALFRRLKVGSGRTSTYRMTTSDQIDALRSSGEILWENARYEAVYVVDRPELNEMLSGRRIPVLHLGQVESIDAIRTGVPEVQWTTVELWCPREVAETRIRDRGTNDTAARLAAWDATDRLAPNQADLRIDTSRHTPAESAEMIRQAVESQCPST